jgi:hypothetical protein
MRSRVTELETQLAEARRTQPEQPKQPESPAPEKKPFDPYSFSDPVVASLIGHSATEAPA